MKEPRFIYGLKGICRALIPRIITQSTIEYKIKTLLQIYNNKLDTIKQRINYYNKLHNNFVIPTNRDDLPQDSPYTKKLPSYPSRLCYLNFIKPNLNTLKNNIYDKSGSVYYFDSYEWTRYFSDSLYWAFMFYDVNQLLSFPAICKSRPIIKDNENSIILQLDKYRHFQFIKDSIRFEDKKDLLFFRGAIYQDHRIRFFDKHFNNPQCDIGHVGNKDSNPQWLKEKVSIKNHLSYKFLLSLEGYDVASNLKWILSSNSLCIMSKPEIETWFMEDKLISGIHYAEIDRNYDNLDSILEYYKTHTKEAKEIIRNANLYCKNFYDKRFEGLLNILVLRKYFYLSNQIEVTQIEKELFKNL